MNESDLQPLKALSLPIVIPKDLAGLSLKRVEPMPDDGCGDGYRIVWTSGSGELALCAASGGIGDRVPGQESIPFQSPTFGRCTLEVDEDELYTGWMSEVESGLPAYSLAANGVTREQFLQVAKSLDYVKI